MYHLIQGNLGYFKEFYSRRHAAFSFCSFERAKQRPELHINPGQLEEVLKYLRQAYPDEKFTVITVNIE